MKHILLILSFVGLVGCSSVPKTGDSQVDPLLAHLTKGKQLVGTAFADKFTKDGFINGEYIAIGSVTDTHSRNEASMHLLAYSKATNRLLMSAPSDYKKVLQNAISSLDDNNGSAEEIAVTVTEAKAITGIKSNFEDFQCVTYATPNTDMKYDIQKECRMIVRIPASNLAKSYTFTMDKKYGVKEDSLKDILKKNMMDKVLDEPTRTVSSEPELPKSAKAYE